MNDTPVITFVGLRFRPPIQDVPSDLAGHVTNSNERGGQCQARDSFGATLAGFGDVKVLKGCLWWNDCWEGLCQPWVSRRFRRCGLFLFLRLLLNNKLRGS